MSVPGLARTLAPWAAVAAMASPMPLATLKPESVRGWLNYVAAVEQRRAENAAKGAAFLALDSFTDAAERRRQLRRGAIVIDQVDPPVIGGEAVSVPSAEVHHWRGAVFVPGITAHQLLSALETNGPDTGQDDILESRILERHPDWQRVFLRVKREKVITAVYDTEHLVRFARPAPDRATSSTTATRIAEVEEAGTPGEHELPPGRDRGFLWRWNASWRYQDTPGGVIVECESLSLSRDVPVFVRYLVAPMIRSTAREAMEVTLVALRDRYAGTGPAN